MSDYAITEDDSGGYTYSNSDLSTNWDNESSDKTSKAALSVQSGSTSGMGNSSKSSSGSSSSDKDWTDLMNYYNSWDSNVGKTSTITGGTRTVGGSSSGSSDDDDDDENTDNSSVSVGSYEDYEAGEAPEYQSTYVEPDESKIASLAMSGGGNALRDSMGKMISSTLASSAALPLAVRRAMIDQLTEEVAEGYSEAMPSIRTTAASEWSSLYGEPQSEAIAAQNSYDWNQYVLSENEAYQEYLSRLSDALGNG